MMLVPDKCTQQVQHALHYISASLREHVLAYSTSSVADTLCVHAVCIGGLAP